MAEDLGGRLLLAGELPGFEVIGGDLGEGGVEFYSDDLLEGELRGEHDGTAFSAA